MTDWKKVQGDSYPELVDTTSSASTVYERRNVTEETTEMMGGEPVVVFSYEERTYTKEEYAERFTRLNEIAMTFGCYMAHENVVDFSGATPEFMTLLKEYGKENFKMVLDVKQARKSDILPDEFIKAVGGNIAHVHLSDCTPTSMCTPPSEKGLFDFGKLFTQLDSINYKGKYIIELYSDGFEDVNDIINSAEYLENIMQSLNIKNKHI